MQLAPQGVLAAAVQAKCNGAVERHTLCLMGGKFPAARAAHARQTASSLPAQPGQHSSALTLLASTQLKKVVGIGMPPAPSLLCCPAAGLGFGLPEADARRAAAICRSRLPLLLLLQRGLDVRAVACADSTGPRVDDLMHLQQRKERTPTFPNL